MLAIMESRLRLSGFMWGICWAYVGPMLGYSDGWVGLCWAKYSHICGAQMSRFWCPTKFGVSQCSVWIASCQTHQNVLCPAIHVSKISMKSIIQEAHICHLEEALKYITIYQHMVTMKWSLVFMENPFHRSKNMRHFILIESDWSLGIPKLFLQKRTQTTARK